MVTKILVRENKLFILFYKVRFLGMTGVVTRKVQTGNYQTFINQGGDPGSETIIFLTWKRTRGKCTVKLAGDSSSFSREVSRSGTRYFRIRKYRSSRKLPEKRSGMDEHSCKASNWSLWMR